MRRIILVTLALFVCVALIARAAGQFAENQAQAFKDRTQIGR